MAGEDLRKVAQRVLALSQARDDLLQFMKLTMPDPEDIDDPLRSRYEGSAVARLLCQIFEKVERRELTRVAVSIPPQHGKSQITSRGGPAWMIGRNPYINGILGTYNQDYADELGDAVREIITSPACRQVFGEGILRVGGKAKDLLISEKGGRFAFVGRGGSGTGKPADVFIVDDPLKDDMEAQSDTTREQVWNWFNKVALTRCHTKSAIMIVHTRWHQDDLIGRLCDPDHPERNKRFKGIAKRWKYINIPAIIEDPKLANALGLKLEPSKNPDVVSMFGLKPISALWPERHDLAKLAEAKQMDPAGFSALYMGNPSPADGDYFKAEWLVEYDRDELPSDLKIYGASDHGLGEKTQNDPSCIGCVGVDEKDNIWVLPDLVWERMQTDRIVEELLDKFKTHKPMVWWLEQENIAKAFGPFLLKRMHEEKIYVTLGGHTPSKSKMVRARSIQGRMQMRKVHFPRFAHWWPDAKKELLNFPNGAHDDFVDFLSHVGLGLLQQVRPEPRQEDSNVIEIGSIAWTLKAAQARAEREKRASGAKGW